MKRIQAACITQTLHFLLKEDLGRDYAKKVVQEEVEKYKVGLDRNKTPHCVLHKMGILREMP